MVSYFALSGLSASRASTNSCKERLLFGLGGGNGVMVSLGVIYARKADRFRYTTSNLVELRERAYHSLFHQGEGGSPWKLRPWVLFRIGN
jgi:hypothetical protein